MQGRRGNGLGSERERREAEHKSPFYLEVVGSGDRFPF